VDPPPLGRCARSFGTVLKLRWYQSRYCQDQQHYQNERVSNYESCNHQSGKFGKRAGDF
jgi:hypothetical protein